MGRASKSKAERRAATARPAPQRQPPAPARQAPARPANGSALAAEIVAGVRHAAAIAGGESALPSPPDDDAGARPAADLSTLWRQAKQVQLVYDQAVRGLREREAEAAAGEEQLERKRSELAERERTVVADEEERRERLQELMRRAEALDERDGALLQRERDLGVERERLREFALGDARQELTGLVERIEGERRALQAHGERALAALQDDMTGRRGELEAERARLTAERERLRAWKLELAVEAEDLADARALQTARLERAVARATESCQVDLESLAQRHRAAQERVDRLEAEREEHANFRRRLGERSEEEIVAGLQELDSVRAELRRLQLTPPDDARRRLVELEEQWQALVGDRATLRAENERLQRQLAGYEISATELERLSRTKEAQDAAVQAYRVTIEDLERRWGDLVQRQEGESPFPQCTAMDGAYGEEPEDLVERLSPLPELVAAIRALIRQQHNIFYEEEDLRCFLAGLAASRLHLLEGISGTGKTQLPQRVAEALGATSAVISVGADWRTPQDLMGYYNAFERRFYESEFTQALYRAQCPRYLPQPFLIVLDEMNLSHPEQYFNDVLSELEKNAERRGDMELVLMNSGVDPAPRLLVDRRKIRLPDNVWLVGTANNDETTMMFADKTYDRAHVLELPARHRFFQKVPVEPLPPVSMKALTRAFAAARSQHRKERDQVQEFLEGPLQERMIRDFEVSWGSRLQRQVRSFVPVLVACGGSAREAADHIVATKILRKLRGHYEVRVEDLRRLESELPAMLEGLDGDGPPAKTLRVLELELRRRTPRS
jgi:hypothetical protein